MRPEVRESKGFSARTAWLALLPALASLAAPELCAQTPAPTPSQTETAWTRVREHAGIEVWALRVPGRSLPVFRSRGLVPGGLYEVLAVIRDVARHTEWLHQCVDARVLSREGERVAVVYNRTDAPWPVGDRTVVLRSEVLEPEPGRRVEVRLRAIDAPLPADVRGTVRMRRFEGHYKLEARGPASTWVEYQIDADPGGNLPALVARSATREIPLYTLLNLRTQLERTRGQYADFVSRWGSPVAP